MIDLMTFLKAVADPTRLNILGLVAQGPRSVDELAAILNLSAPTISHHLARLNKVGLVVARAEQYYNFYTLEAETFQRYVTQLTPEQLAQRVQRDELVEATAYQDQILARWVKDERLQGLPTQVQQRRVVLAWLAEKFALDRRYAPQQVDDLLAYWANWPATDQLDSTTLRRALVDASLLARTRDGRWYWRAAALLAQGADFTPDMLPVADTTRLHVPFSITSHMALVRIAIGIKAGKAYTMAEIDAMIQSRRKDEGNDPAPIRNALVAASLLELQEDGAYVRPALTPDHPAMVELRNEALARHEALRE
ncbi:MAG: metalloregulator ArsR/SmtB family transcription factor [Caldilineaceae bacterium]